MDASKSLKTDTHRKGQRPLQTVDLSLYLSCQRSITVLGILYDQLWSTIYKIAKTTTTSVPITLSFLRL